MTYGINQPQAWAPNWAVHPGAVPQEHLEARGLSQAEFARLAGLSPKLAVPSLVNVIELQPKLRSVSNGCLA